MPSEDTLWLIGAIIVFAGSWGVPLSMRSDVSAIERTLKRIERLLEEERREQQQQRRR